MTSLSCRHHHAAFPVAVVPLMAVISKGWLVYLGPDRIQVVLMEICGLDLGASASFERITCCGLGCPNDSVKDVFSGLETAVALSSGEMEPDCMDCSNLLYRDDEAVNERWRHGEVGFGGMNGGDGNLGGTVCCRLKSC